MGVVGEPMISWRLNSGFLQDGKPLEILQNVCEAFPKLGVPFGGVPVCNQ